MLALLLATLLAVTAPAVIVVDDDGRPVAATVRFISASDSVAAVATDVNGTARPPGAFRAVRATVEAAGFEPASTGLADGLTRIVLHRVVPLIGSVRVATGSTQSLHRLPVSASVLDATAIQNSPARTADALLRELPGFDRTRSNSMFTNYGQLRVSFNGAGNDRGVVLADGLPAQDAFGGQVDWIAYPPGNLTRAELLRGAGSALYGSGAVGGVLELDTRAPPGNARAPAEATLSFGAGGLGASDAAVFLGAPLGRRLAVSLWSSTMQAAYYDLPPSFRSPVDQIARSQGDATQLRLRTMGSPAIVDIVALFSTDAQAQGRPNYSFGRTLQQASIGYAFPGARTTTSVQAYARASTVLNIVDQFPAAPGVLRYVQRVPTWENGVFASWLRTGDRLDIEARADVHGVHGISDQRGADQTLQSIGSGSQSLAGIALQSRVHGPRFETLLGVRYDSVTFAHGDLASRSARGVTTVTDAPSRTDAAVSPRLALRYDLFPSVALRASSGGGFRAPFLNELVRGFQIGSVVMAPNPSLVPERSRSSGAGIDIVGGRSRLSFDLNQTMVNDAIAFVTLSPTLQRRANVVQTRTDGTSVTYTALLSPCTRLRVGGQTQYARVTAGPRRTIGKRLAYVPDREAIVAIDAQGGLARYGVDATFLGATYADDLNTQPLGSAFLFGARVGLPIGRDLTLTFAAENLTNRSYLSSVDRLGPPASVSLRLAVPLGAQATASRPAPARC